MLATDAPLKSKIWRCDPRLDQRNTPHCVGYSFTHDHAAEPQRRKVNETLADRWYKWAQDHDEWAGSSYAGSSILGGAKAGVALGYFSEYRWAFSVNEVLRTVGHLGPVLVGTIWTRSMFSPDNRGLVKVSGATSGGHAWMIRGVDLNREEIVARNSWGRDWSAIGGDFRLSFADLGRLLEEQGDCAFPVRQS